jgi:hypothetical protein
MTWTEARWMGVDHIFNGEKFGSLRNVTVELGADDEDVSNDLYDRNVRQRIVDDFPLLTSRGLLDCHVAQWHSLLFYNPP